MKKGVKILLLLTGSMVHGLPRAVGRNLADKDIPGLYGTRRLN